jgi:hypothetical protein
LTPASGRQDHTISPSHRSVRPHEKLTLQTDAPTASHPSVRDDRETPLFGQAETGRNVNLICPTVQADMLRQNNPTGSSRFAPAVEQRTK